METILQDMSVTLARRNVPHVGTDERFEGSLFLNKPGEEPCDLQNALVLLDNPKNTVCLHDLITERNAEIAAKNVELAAKNAELEKIRTDTRAPQTVNDIYETIIRNILKKKKKKEEEFLAEALSCKKKLYQFFDDNKWVSCCTDNNVMKDIVDLYENKSTATVRIESGQHHYTCYYDKITNEFIQKNTLTHRTRKFRLIDQCTLSSLPEEYVRKLFNTPIQMSDLLGVLGDGDPNEIVKKLSPYAAHETELESSDIVDLGELYSKYSLQKKYDSKKSEIWVRAFTMLSFFRWCIKEDINEFVIGFHGSTVYDSIKSDGFTLKYSGRNGSLKGPGYYLSLGTDTIPHDYSAGCSNESSYANGSVIMCLVPINLNTAQMVYYKLETQTMLQTPGPLDTCDNVCKALESRYFLPLGILAHTQEQKTQ